MHVLNVTNVNDALPLGIQLIENRHDEIAPRGETTWEYPEPVTTVYKNPRQRVLFSPLRNKNHYFELFEALWILAGRRDTAFLHQFNKQMINYSDDEKVFNAAYGYRLREHHGYDQISRLVKLFERDPDTRQGVLQIWDTNRDLNMRSKDIPCNDVLFFKLRNGKLNLTVANRSNDIIWGAYGTNAVQFSMIQEYVAMHIGAEVGTYRQVSDSYHLYLGLPLAWELMEHLNISTTLDPYNAPNAAFALSDRRYNEYIYPTPLIAGGETPSEFDLDLTWFFMIWDEAKPAHLDPSNFKTRYFKHTVVPMYKAWVTRDPLHLLFMPPNSDWRLGGSIWFETREKKLAAKETA